MANISKIIDTFAGMRPLIIRSRLAPKHFAINIFGTIWSRDTSWIDRFVVNHERIHTAQQRELLFVPFYILYGIEWLIRIFMYRNRDLAYRNISFEREAYANGHDLSYLPRRRHYSWLGYLRRGDASKT